MPGPVPSSVCPKMEKGCVLRIPHQLSNLRIIYQGTIFLKPFFFLLLDSFCFFPSSCDELVAPSALCELVDESGPFAAPLPFVSPEPAALPVVGSNVVAPASVPVAGVVGVVVSPPDALVGEAVAALPSAGEAASAPPVPSAGAGPPGVTVSTTAVFAAAPPPRPICAFNPPLKMSVADVLSASGCKLG